MRWQELRLELRITWGLLRKTEWIQENNKSDDHLWKTVEIWRIFWIISAPEGSCFLFDISLQCYDWCMVTCRKSRFPFLPSTTHNKQCVEWQETLGDTQQLDWVQPCVCICKCIVAHRRIMLQSWACGSPGCPIKVFLVGGTSEGLSCQLLRDQRPTVESTFLLISGVRGELKGR